MAGHVSDEAPPVDDGGDDRDGGDDARDGGGDDAREDTGDDLVDENAERLRREALRVYERYAVEVVEAFQLCPWARRARLDGRVRTHVLLDATPGAERVLARIDEIFRDPRIEIGLILLPRVRWERQHFRRFVEEVRAGHAARHLAARASGPPPLAMAAFHPWAPLDLGSAARLVTFLRRTPDPTIQIVRQSALAAVRGSETSGAVYAPRAVLDLVTRGGPGALDALAAWPLPMADRVAESNLATVQREGAERIHAILDDIRADRDRAYAALGASVAGRSSPWSLPGSRA
jgi:hypothetical protein